MEMQLKCMRCGGGGGGGGFSIESTYLGSCLSQPDDVG